MAADLLLLSVPALIWLRILWREASIRRRFPPIGVMVPLEDGPVHALQKGAGRDLVLIHGASGQLRDLLPLMELLAPHYRVTAFDRPGLGHSASLGAAGVSPAAQAQHLARAAAMLGLNRPIVLGQSYGGAVALAWGLEVTGDQAAQALVLVSSPSLPWPGKLDWWYRLTETYIGRALATTLATAVVSDRFLDGVTPGLFAPNPAPPDYAARIGAALALPRRALAANAAQVNGLFAHVSAMKGRYGGLALPVELLHGTEDVIVPATVHSIPLSDLIPTANLVLLPGIGHMPHHVVTPEVAAAIARAASRAGWT